MRASFASFGFLLLIAPPAFAGGQDGFVDPAGVSHVDWQDRTPIVPVRSEAFRVRFQSYQGDLTGALVRQFVAGTPTRVFTASVIAQRGPYDIWEALLDARDVDLVSYDIVLMDGADTDYIGTDGYGEFFTPGGALVLDFIDFTHAPPGSTPVTGGTVFHVWAPTAPTAYVRGSFNNWSLADPMTKVGDDFYAMVPGAVAGDQYKYFFEASGTWKADAFPRRLNPGEFNNTFIVDPVSYTWQSAPFTPPPFEEMVCYQLHVGSFAGRNDPVGPAPAPSRFIDVAARADHLVELGVNVVYLNPVLEFPGDFSGGYNPITHTALESALGTPDEFKQMVDAFHQRGIAVILDVVYNHLSFSDNYLFNYLGSSPAANIYFDTPPAVTPWGDQVDVDEPRVREFILDAVVMMLDEYRLDGFRVDAVAALVYGDQPVSSIQLVRDLNTLADNRYEDKIFIVEVFGDDPWFSRPVANGGLGFDAQYHSGFRDAVRGATFDAAFGDPNVGALAFAATRSGFHELQGTRVFNYFELHDEIWPVNGNQRAVRTIDTTFPHDDEFAAGRTKLAQGITLLAKGIPAIAQGSEWLEDEGWELNKIDWAHKTAYSGIFDFYKDVITLRTSTPALFADADAWNYHTNETANVFVFERSEPGGESWVVVANFGNADWTGPGGYRIGLPRAGTWGVAVNSEAAHYGGSGVGTAGVFQAESVPWGGLAQSVVLELPAHGFLLLQHEPPDPPVSNYCATGFNGATMALSAGSSLDVADNDFTLTASPVPDSFGLFYFGDAQSSLPFGDCGMRCIAGNASLRRLTPQAALGGVATRDLDLTTDPGDDIGAGTTWNFQYWFRETVNCTADFDLSDGLNVTFNP